MLIQINTAAIVPKDHLDLEYLKELCELHNDYPLAPDEIKIERKMLSSSQLKIANFYNNHIGTVENWFLTFLIKKSMCFIMKTYNFIGPPQ